MNCSSCVHAAHHNWPTSSTVLSCKGAEQQFWMVCSYTSEPLISLVSVTPSLQDGRTCKITWVMTLTGIKERDTMNGQSQHFQVFFKPTICVTLHPTFFVQMWHHVTWQTDNNALEEIAKSIIRVEVPMLKIKAANSSKILVIYMQDDLKS